MAGGRPRIEIDQKEFESLLSIQCTLEEIVAFFQHKLGRCSEATIERWCKRTYKESFADISLKKRAAGKISLRRAGWQLAMKNPSVHIFYCKNYLGMTDKQEMVQETTIGISDGFVEALNGTAADDWSEENESEDSDI